MSATTLATLGALAAELAQAEPVQPLVEGLLMAVTGAAAGLAVLQTFRLLRDLAQRLKK